MRDISFDTVVSDVSRFAAVRTDERSLIPRHQIRTTRIYMRPVCESDLVEYIELLSDPAVMRYVGFEAGSVPGFQQIAQLHSDAVKTWETRGFGRWSMFDYKSLEFMGFCGFRSDKGKPELICALREKFWGKGLAVEASAACLRYGFEMLGFSEVAAITRPEHERARKALDKLNADFLGVSDFYGVPAAAYQILPDSFEF
jgi:RimJ/RimL family protein N-acetyltransferase